MDMTPKDNSVDPAAPDQRRVVRELGRLAFRLGLLDDGLPDWTALARACGVSPAALFAVMERGGQVGKETLVPLLNGILAVTNGLYPGYNVVPLVLALGVLTRADLEATGDQWRARLIRGEFSDDPRSSD
jgi:hypothetical protein